MNTGKTLFAQMIDFLPWKTFGRIVARMMATAGCARSVAASNIGRWRSPN